MKLHVPIAGATLWVLLGLTGCNGGESEEEKAAAPQAATYNVYVLREQTLEVVVPATGSIRAAEEVELRTELAGKVRKIHFEEGASVKKGQLLLEIDDDDLRAQLQRVSAQMALAQSDVQRQEALLELEGVSREQYDQAVTNLETLKADKALLEAQLADARIYAPFAGQIGLRWISEGAYVDNDTPIAYLVQTNPLKVDFSVPELFAGRLQAGMSVEFTVAGQDSIYTAQVYAVDPRVDPASRMLQARALIKNPPPGLTPGAFARLVVKMEKIDNALLVPSEAIVPELNAEVVYRIKGGKAEKVTVQSGIRKESLVQIEQGLSVGDTVLVTGLLAMRDGTPVKAGEVVNDDFKLAGNGDE